MNDRIPPIWDDEEPTKWGLGGILRKPNRLGFAVLLGVGSILMSACESGELIKRHSTAGFNGGFETTEAGYPVNWAFFPNPEADGALQIALDAEDVLEGDYSLRVTTRASEVLPGIRSRRIEVEPGKEYRLSLSFKNEGCNLKVNRIVQDASGKTVLRREIIVDTSTSSAEWVTFEETLAVSADEANVLLVILIDGSGTVRFDDVKVEGIEE